MFKFNLSHRMQLLRQTLSVVKKTVALVWSIDRSAFAIGLFAALVPAIVPFANAYIYKLLIDSVAASLTSQTIDYQHLLSLVALRIGTYLLTDFVFATQTYFERIIWAKIPIQLNQLLFTKITSLDLQYFENSEHRNAIEKARDSINWRIQNLISYIFYSSQSLLQFIIAFVAIVTLNSWLAILAIFIAIPEFYVSIVQSRARWSLWDAQSNDQKRMHYLTHVLHAHREVKEVKLFHLADTFLDQIRTIYQRFYRDNLVTYKHEDISKIGFNIINTAYYIGIETYVVFQVLQKKLTLGDISFYTTVLSQFQNGIGGLFRNLNSVYDASLYAKHIFDVMAYPQIIQEAPDPVRLKTNAAFKIEFIDVTFSYPGTKAKILDKFNLEIQPGEKIAFVGENGAGKSTIIKLLARVYDVTSGQILINDIDIKRVKIADLHDAIGVLLQDFNRYEDTVSDNIFYGNVNRAQTSENITLAATLAGADKMILNLEKQYQQILGRMFDSGIELSGGQWQKVALARAFFRDAPILVLDEPTASIDAKAESEIFSRVEKLSRNKTVIIISHRFSTVRNADKIYVLDKGKIIESGSHQQLLEANGRYAKLFNLQAKGYK